MRNACLVGIVLFAMLDSFVHEAAARSSSDTRPLIGHHSGMNGPSKAGWGGKGGYHH
jgi:hypothetical protein